MSTSPQAKFKHERGGFKQGFYPYARGSRRHQSHRLVVCHSFAQIYRLALVSQNQVLGVIATPCVRACVRARARVCVCVCVCVFDRVAYNDM